MAIRRFLSDFNTFYKNNLYFYKNRDKLYLSKQEYSRLSKYNKFYRSSGSSQFNGNKISFSSPFWFLHSVDEIFVQEVYKFPSDKKNPIIIDCGANIGLSVLYFKEIHKASKIIAFEADPSVYKQLKSNIAEYNYSNIDLINAAVWNEETKIVFSSEGSVGGKMNLEGHKSNNDVEVPAIRLRNYLSTEIDFLKIDIEGAEYEVLKDCADLLLNVNNLFIEYHVLPNERQHLHDILKWIDSAGFKYYLKEAWNNMTHPFTKHHNDLYHMQLNIFCYR